MLSPEEAVEESAETNPFAGFTRDNQVTRARKRISSLFSAVWLPAFVVGLCFPISSEARVLELLGVGEEPYPTARFLEWTSTSAFAYEQLNLLEVPLTPKGTSIWTALVPRKKAAQHQNIGAFEVHRRALNLQAASARDDAELLGFEKPEEISCFSVRVEARKPPVDLDPKAGHHGYSWTCVLSADGQPISRLLLEVRKKATDIHFAPDNRRPVIRVAQIPHLLMDLPHRGRRALPAIEISHAYRVPIPNDGRYIYLLIFERSRPPIADCSREHVLVSVHPDKLRRRDGGYITKLSSPICSEGRKYSGKTRVQ